VTSFINIRYSNIAVESILKKQHSIILFSVGKRT